MRNGGLIKTIRFGNSKYVGDPLNTVRIFNEKEVDELIVLDIGTTAQNRKPDYSLIKKIAAECRMPFCYGGGVKKAEEVQKIVGLGVEKVALSTAAVQAPELISDAAQRVGNQSVVVIIDVKKTGLQRRYEVFIKNGTQKTGLNPISFAKTAQEHGAGEVVINNIDLDGTMSGYDLGLAERVKKEISIPLTILGGAGSLEDIKTLFKQCGASGAAAGSLFVFKGKYRAVLINYPNREEKDRLIWEALI